MIISSKKDPLHYKEQSQSLIGRKEYFDQDTPHDLMTLKVLSKEFNKTLIITIHLIKRSRGFLLPLD